MSGGIVGSHAVTSQCTRKLYSLQDNLGFSPGGLASSSPFFTWFVFLYLSVMRERVRGRPRCTRALYMYSIQQGNCMDNSDHPAASTETSLAACVVHLRMSDLTPAE